MKYRLRYFGNQTELKEKLSVLGYEKDRFSVKGYALDNTIEFSASQNEYYEICETLGGGFYGEENATLSSVLVDFLTENNLVMATAESCTGGLVSARIIDASGASRVFHEGVVTYSNQAKMDRLNVSADTLENYGAVSEQTAIEMAYGLLSENVDIAISTTGIAGPDGGSEEKPVGLVYIGIAFQNKEPIALKRIYQGTRNEIRRSAANEAIFRAYEYLVENL